MLLEKLYPYICQVGTSFFPNIQLIPSSTLNVLGLSFTKSLKWNFTISVLSKLVSMKFCINSVSFLHLLDADSIQWSWPPMYGGRLSCVGTSLHTQLFKTVQSKAICLNSSPPLTSSVFHSLMQCCCYFQANHSPELSNCMHSHPHLGPAAQDFPSLSFLFCAPF